MPSASINKPAQDVVVQSSDSTVPVRQIMTAVEHKIRNLEKRKVKLESYQDLRKSGKELTADQEVAISKYEEVVQCLLCAQELLKQIQGISVVWDKEQKKLARKETAARVANEVFKVRETLILQDLLRQLRNVDIRNDFATGSNGAAKLDSGDLALIDKLLVEGFVSLEDAESVTSFEANAHRAADHWVSTVDGKPKQFVLGVTYERVRRVVRAIQDSGYFNRRFGIAPGEAVGVDQVTSSETPQATENEALLEEEEQQQQLTEASPTNDAQLPAAAVVVAAQEISIPVLQAEVGNVPPTPPVNFHAFPQQQPPATETVVQPNPNSLPEELQSGAFSFLQDSELDDCGGGGGTSNGPAAVVVVTGPAPTLSSHPSPVQVLVPTQHPQPIPTPQQQQQQQQQQQPHANLLLINPMIPIPQQHVDHVVVNGGGGITPPMFQAFPFQAATVATANGLAQQVPVNSVAAGGPAMNPFQQLVKTLSYNHMMQMNGSNQPPGPIQSAPMVEEKVSEQPAQRNSPVGQGSAEQMTISEWNPVGKTSAGQEQHNGQGKRETSADSSSGGGERRRHDDRPHHHHQRHHRPNGNDTNAGGYGGSRRRYMDRPSHNNHNGNGGNYNGSRMHRSGAGGGDGETTTSSYRSGPKPNHYPPSNNRGSGGATNGNSSASTFYRNNDPNYYHQNGVKTANGGVAAAANGSRN